MLPLNRIPLAAFAAVATTVALAGCGQTKIDNKKAEDLARKIANSGQIHLKSVHCPSGKTAKKGGTFDCDLEYVDGTKGTITLHMTDDKGGVRTSGQDIKIQGQ